MLKLDELRSFLTMISRMENWSFISRVRAVARDDYGAYEFSLSRVICRSNKRVCDKRLLYKLLRGAWRVKIYRNNNCQPQNGGQLVIINYG